MSARSRHEPWWTPKILSHGGALRLGLRLDGLFCGVCAHVTAILAGERPERCGVCDEPFLPEPGETVERTITHIDHETRTVTLGPKE